MKIWWNKRIDSDRNIYETAGGRVRIGRGRSNDLVLDNPHVATEAAILYKRQDAWELVALGLNEIRVGDDVLYGGDRITIHTNEEIQIFPFSLTLDLPRVQQTTQAVKRRKLDEQMSLLISEVHVDLVNRIGRPSDTASAASMVSDDELLSIEKQIELIASDRQFFSKASRRLIGHTAGHSIRAQILDSLSTPVSGQQKGGLLTDDRQWSRLLSTVPDREDERTRTTRYVEKVLKLDASVDLTSRIGIVESDFWEVWGKLEDEIHGDVKRYLALRYLKRQIKDIVFGYGPLESLIRLPTISEIMVVDSDSIYVESAGRVENSGRRFISDEITLTIINRIVSRVGRTIDKASPMVDARLVDGSRVNAVIPPVAVSGPCLTIRKFPAHKILIDDLIGFGSITRTAAEFLRAAVLSRKNILISGGTGTGKTTLLNCLSDFIPDSERIITIEDTAELQLNKRHVVRMETKNANVEGAGEYTIRDLVRNALRMRPDRIVVGECRSGEALDMLQAMNTGHDGSLTTIHANTAEDVVLRLEVLVQMAMDLPLISIHRQVAAAIDLIVQLHRMKDGRRSVVQISEITGIDPVTHRVKIRDLFLLPERGGDDAPELAATGHLPTFMGDLIERRLLALESFYAEETA